MSFNKTGSRKMKNHKMLAKKTLLRTVLAGLSFILVYSAAAETQDDSEPFEITGFVEERIGSRFNQDPNQKDATVLDLRLQLDVSKDFENVSFNLVMDLIADTVLEDYATDLQTGEGLVDLRQANMVFSPLDDVDIKIGRQILTWGTGDLLFINDLFAKDWNAFLIGRDVEYLKAPTDTIKMSWFNDVINMDFVYTAKFGADRYIDGKRISFFDRATNLRRGNEAPLLVNRPDDAFSDDEVAVRFYRNFDVYEAALYFYDGFWKSPAGLDSVTGNATFPSLKVVGASLRGPVAKGIGNIELGYYKSDDNASDDPLKRNSEYRYLIGFEQEVATELTFGAQFYLEQKLDYQEYLSSLPVSAIADEQYRRVLTLRLTKLLLGQNLRLSLFNFYSPSDEDGYTRASVSYKLTDALKLGLGINYFYGEQAHTFYNQFDENNNAYLFVRYGF